MQVLVKSVLSVGLTAAIVTLAGGCFLLPVGPIAGATSTPSPDATESSSPTPTPASDVLFTITAQVTDSGGEVVDLTMTAHQPQASTAAGRESIRDTYITECNALGGGSVSDFSVTTLDPSILESFGSTLMVIDVESEPSGRTFTTPVSLFLGSGFYYQVTTGTGVEDVPSQGCYPGSRLVGTGSVTGITNYETGSAVPELTQWQAGNYGFGIDAAGGSLEHCDIQLTQLAIDSGVSDVEGWTTDNTNATYCAIGYYGE